MQELIKKNFQKSILTYEKNAIIQKETANKLISLIDETNFKNILEIGSYTGLLTKLAVKKFNFEYYLALDIIDSFYLIKNLSPKIHFKTANIENIELNKKFNLIIANASIQWCKDINKVIKKLYSLLEDNGILAFTTFGKSNLIEIKNTFSCSLDYLSKNEIKKILPNAQIIEEKKVLEFNSSIDILKHLKLTGVNSLQQNYKITKKHLEMLGNKLTYNPIYVVLKK